jgi:hypothetical protein
MHQGEHVDLATKGPVEASDFCAIGLEYRVHTIEDRLGCPEALLSGEGSAQFEELRPFLFSPGDQLCPLLSRLRFHFDRPKFFSGGWNLFIKKSVALLSPGMCQFELIDVVQNICSTFVPQLTHEETASLCLSSPPKEATFTRNE